MTFKPGQSGNPGGRAKEKPFADALRMEIAAAGDNRQALRRAARALLVRAQNGDVSALQMLAERLDGKVPQPTGGSDELGPQRLHISWSGNGDAASQAAAAGALIEGHFQAIPGSDSAKTPMNAGEIIEEPKS